MHATEGRQTTSAPEPPRSPRRPLSEFRRLQELRVFLEPDADGKAETTLHLTITTEDPSPLTVSLRAHGVRELHAGFSGAPVRILGLAIEPLEGRQWERLNWRVFDREGDRLGFVCRYVELSELQGGG